MNRLQRWVPDIAKATFFDIQNVAEYYFNYKAENAWTSKDFTIAPPLPRPLISSLPGSLCRIRCQMSIEAWTS